MDLPDPKRLFDYYSELHDAGFGDKTARAIVAAVAGAAAHGDLTATLEVTAERVHPYTFPEIVEAIRREVEKSGRDESPNLDNAAVMAEETLKGLADARREVACLFDTENREVRVRCEPSLGGGVAYLSLDKRGTWLSSHLTRSETVLLRDTLTAILEAE